MTEAPHDGGIRFVDLRAILDQPDLIKTVFQPLVDLRTGRVAGYEALSRFPDAGGRPPTAWFFAAHANGCGAELELCAAARALNNAKTIPEGTCLSLNLSPSVLCSKEFEASAVASELARGSSRFIVEVTEHERATVDSKLAGSLSWLRSEGVRIAVDDAGCGHAGLTWLAALAPDMVKLDRELVTGVSEDRARAALVDAFARFCLETNAEVVAEGIEDLSDLVRLCELDIAFGQGYALGRPTLGWGGVHAPAVIAIRESVAAAMRIGQPADTGDAVTDLDLERAGAALGSAIDRIELVGALNEVAAALGADAVTLSAFYPGANLVETIAGSGVYTEGEIFALAEYPATTRVLASGEAIQILASDPDADPREVNVLRREGYRSLLMIPVMAAAGCVGLLEAYSVPDRPWSRRQLARARLFSHQCGGLIGRFVATDGNALPAIIPSETV